MRQECLDHLIILNEKHLRQVLNEFVMHYNTARPRQGIHQQLPIPQPDNPSNGAIQLRNRVGGIIREYFREAA